MAQRRLILIRHSQSRPEPGVSPARWQLTARGRAHCGALAEILTPFDLKKIYCSDETKAVETAGLAASPLNLPVEIVQGVHEHDRTGTPFLAQSVFTATLKRFFAEPKELVFGTETAQESCERFTRSIRALVARESGADTAVVTHGTVLSLFAGAHSSWDPYQFWQNLNQPAVIVFHVPSFTLAQTTFTV